MQGFANVEEFPIIRIKRIYDPQDPGDGFRVLIDRLWPRGLSKARAKVDEWRREIAPSDELRKWFQHDPEKFEEFRSRYRKELEEHMGSVEKLSNRARNGHLTILYSAHDTQHNNAIVLKEFLEEFANNGRRRKAS